MNNVAKKTLKKYNFEFIDYLKIERALRYFKGCRPFDHCVIDDFFLPNIASKLESEFIPYEDDRWYYYKNPLEDKKGSE